MFHNRLKTAYITTLILFGFTAIVSSADAAWTLQPSISVKGGYDSNPSLLPRDSAKEWSYKTDLSPYLLVTRKGKSSTLKGSYSMNALFYHNDPDLNYETHNAMAGAEFKTGKKSYISLTDNFSLTKGGAESGIVTGVYLSRANIRRNNVTLNFGTGIGNFWDIGLTLSDSNTLYSDPTLVDNRTDAAKISADYKLSRKSTITSGYNYNRLFFDETGGSTIRETHNLTLGAAMTLSPGLRAALSGGLLYSENVSGNFDWTMTSSLKKEAQKYLLALAFQRSVKDSSGLSTEVEINNRLELSGEYDIRQNINIHASAVGIRLKSEPDRTVDLSSLDTGVGAGWRVNSKISIDLTISRFTQWVDTSPADSVQRDQIFLGLTYTPTEWRL